MFTLPLQLLDSFLLNYNLGDALIVGFGLGLLATLPMKSRKLTTLHVILFGLVFVLTPASTYSVNADGAHLLASSLQYKLLGLGLLVVGPVLFATAKR
jgi:hypothetical protein